MMNVKKKTLIFFMSIIMILQGIPGTAMSWSMESSAADYSNNGCVRWVKDRASAIGITLPSTGTNEYGLYGASAYWTTLSSYPHGSEPAPNSLAVWKFNNGSDGQGGKYGHVAFVESVNGDNVTVTEGGCRGYSYNGNTGVICRTQSKSKMSTLGGCSGFYGYIYLAHSHSYSSSVTTQPTCTATGVRTYSCGCGSSYTETIPAKGHSYDNKVIAPTLVEKGYTSHTCSVCKYTYKDNYVAAPVLKEDGWYYSDMVPKDVSADEYTIEYQNYYEKIQSASPGADWTKTATVKNEWQNSGSVYTSTTDLPTSDSRVLVNTVYYHFCGPNTGLEGNYEQTDRFVHYDDVNASSVIPTYCGDDNGHSYYVLDWIDGGGRVWCQSGVTCDGSYGSHGSRCKAWYKMNYYQDRVKVEQYKYSKKTDWTSVQDASAQAVKIRFKKIEQPIQSEEEKVEENPAQNEQEPDVVQPEADNTKPETDNTKPETDNTKLETEQSVNMPQKNDTISKPKKVGIVSVKNIKTKSLRVSWKFQKNVKGYQLQIATKKNFKTGRITKIVVKNNITWSGLKKGKTYYVRVRAYNVYKGVKQFGSWSVIKGIKIRK